MNDIRVVKATSDHSAEVIHLLKHHFVPKEPLSIVIGLEWDEMTTIIEGIVKASIDEGHSFVALNNDQRVVGCRLSSLKRIESTPDSQQEEDYFQIPEPTSPGVKILTSMFRSLMTGWTRELPDARNVFEFILMCVEDSYGGRGIGGELVRRSLQRAEELRVDYIYTVATNWKTQRLFAKLGFETLRTKNYEDFRVGGQLDEGRLRALIDEHKCMKWMVKKMKKV